MLIWKVIVVVVGGWVGGWYLDYSVSSGPFLRFSMRFEFLSEMFDHSVCETRDPSLTICWLTFGNIAKNDTPYLSLKLMSFFCL